MILDPLSFTANLTPTEPVVFDPVSTEADLEPRAARPRFKYTDPEQNTCPRPHTFLLDGHWETKFFYCNKSYCPKCRPYAQDKLTDTLTRVLNKTEGLYYFEYDEEVNAALTRKIRHLGFGKEDYSAFPVENQRRVLLTNQAEVVKLISASLGEEGTYLNLENVNTLFPDARLTSEDHEARGGAESLGAYLLPIKPIEDHRQVGGRLVKRLGEQVVVETLREDQVSVLRKALDISALNEEEVTALKEEAEGEVGRLDKNPLFPPTLDEVNEYENDMIQAMYRLAMEKGFEIGMRMTRITVSLMSFFTYTKESRLLREKRRVHAHQASPT